MQNTSPSLGQPLSNTFDETTMSMFLDDTTSPSQLDAALGQTFNEAFAMHPTTSQASQVRGRSMKDYEEKQAHLKKENFDLKLRIYFLEERMGQISGLKDIEKVIKENIALRVENESWQKELGEKQDLLCQAAKALDLLEEKHTKEIGSLKIKIQDQEKELAIGSQQQLKFSAMAQSTDSQYSSACFEVDQLVAQVQDLQDQNKEDRLKINRLEAELCNSKQQNDSFKKVVDSQSEMLSKIEEIAGVKQADLYNRVQKLLDCEKLVSDLQSQIKAQEETMAENENRHAKVQENAKAKIRSALQESQRLREKVKTLKKWRHDELQKRPSECAQCVTNASEKQGLLQKLNQKSTELENQNQLIDRNAEVMRQLMSDLEENKNENKLKDVKINKLKQLVRSKPNEEKSSEKKLSDEDKECSLQSIQASLKEKESQLVACEQRLEARDNRIQELELEIQTLRREYSQIADTTNLLKTKPEVMETNCNDTSHEDLRRELSEKDREIENLNMELKKRTFNLQELVNKELWDKNKQIERLELRLAAQGAVCDSKELDLKEAKRKLAEFGVTVTPFSQLGSEVTSDDVSQLQEQLKISLEEQKYLSREVDSLKERLRNTPERDSESIRVQRLLQENKRLMDAVGHQRFWRREASKALSVLRTRLEELAIFLDDLLHQPALVVGLCADRQRVLRAAINGSLELSRTIANLSNESVSEELYSHLECTGDNSSLCTFSHEDAESGCHHAEYVLRPDNSVDCEKSSNHIPNTHWSQNVTPPKHSAGTGSKDNQPHSASNTRPRRRSRSHPQSAIHLKPEPSEGPQSDSEGWSEPDRSVSQARMGIHNESSRTVSSVASTVRRVSLGEQSSSSSHDSKSCRTKSSRQASVKDAVEGEDHKLAVRTQCLEKLNLALESELQAGLPSSLPLPDDSGDQKSTSECAVESSKLRERLIWERNARKAWQQCAGSRLQQLQVLSKANSTLSEKVLLQERQHKEKQSELLDMKFAVVEMTQNADEKQSLSTQTMRGLEEKIQELSVQVLEMEVGREKAEHDAQQALEEKQRLQKDLGGRLAIAEKEAEQARREGANLQMTLKQLLSRKCELEIEVKCWVEKAQELEKEVEKWKRLAHKCEVEVKEVHSQLSHKFKERILLLEQSRNAAEQRAEDWLAKFNESEAKYIEIDRRAKEKVHLMEEQLKLKQAEIDRRSEELQEKLKREAEIRASRKLEIIVEQRMAEYDLETRVATNKQLRDAEAALLSHFSDRERKAEDLATDSERQIRELQEKHQTEVTDLKERLAEARQHIQGNGAVQRQLNEAAVATSQAQLETARLANEKLQLEQHVRWLQAEATRDRKQLQDQLTLKILSLTQANTELQKHLKELEREFHSNHSKHKGCSSQMISGSGSSEGKVLTEITNLKHCKTDISDYVSEQEENPYPESSHQGWYGAVPQSKAAVVLTADGNTLTVGSGAERVTTASPDLGIESDQGRFSSLEAFPLKKSITAPALNFGDEFALSFQMKNKPLDYKGLELENQELKQRLQHTRHTLEQTYSQLAAANQRKRLVEKAICKQLHKTHHILRRARDNFETNSPPTPQPEDSLQ